jgi:hypothetical protein
MKKWEYSTCSSRQTALLVAELEMLNSYGEEGWELVSAVPAGLWTRFFFKRPMGMRREIEPLQRSEKRPA